MKKTLKWTGLALGACLLIGVIASLAGGRNNASAPPPGQIASPPTEMQEPIAESAAPTIPEATRRQIFFEEASGQAAGLSNTQAYAAVSQKYGITADQAQAISAEGAASGWPVPATEPPFPTMPPSATPPPASPPPTSQPTPSEAITSITALPVTVVPTPAATGPVANTAANLRAGPGTNYPIVGGVQGGQGLALAAQSPDGSWYQLAAGSWILATLVNGAPVLPSAALIPTSMPTAAPAIPIRGLGISRATLEAPFAGMGVDFSAGQPVDGQPQVVGRSEGGTFVVQLIGPPENVSDAEVAVFGSSGNKEGNFVDALAMSYLLATALPDWADGMAWLDESSAAGAGDEIVPTAQGNYEVTLSESALLGCFILAVKPAAL